MMDNNDHLRNLKEDLSAFDEDVKEQVNDGSDCSEKNIDEEWEDWIPDNDENETFKVSCFESLCDILLPVKSLLSCNNNNNRIYLLKLNSAALMSLFQVI